MTLGELKDLLDLLLSRDWPDTTEVRVADSEYQLTTPQPISGHFEPHGGDVIVLVCGKREA